MRSLVCLTLALSLAVLGALAGCGGDSAPLSPPEVRPLAGTTGVDDPELHAALAAMWSNTDGVLMQIFRTTIMCETGGAFTVRPAGWPEGHEVVLEVEPGTVPLNRSDPVDFAIHIPVTGSAGAATVPYEFEPHGIRFSKPVHITLVWPTWAGQPPGGRTELWYLEQEYHDGDIHYRVADLRNGAATADGAPRRRYAVDHFSRWTMADSGKDTTDSVLIEPLLRAAVGSACWTELASDPDVHVSAQ